MITFDFDAGGEIGRRHGGEAHFRLLEFFDLHFLDELRNHALLEPLDIERPDQLELVRERGSGCVGR